MSVPAGGPDAAAGQEEGEDWGTSCETGNVVVAVVAAAAAVGGADTPTDDSQRHEGIDVFIYEGQ